MGRGADRRGKKLPAISNDDYSEATLARIRAEQLYAIARFTPAILVVNIWNVLVLVAALYGTPKETAALGWAFAVCSVSAYLYLRGVAARERRLSRASRAVTRNIVTGAAVVGGLWCLALGVALAVAGVVWSEKLADRAGQLR